MKLFITVDNTPGQCPQDSPRIKSLEKQGWKLDSLHYPDGREGARAEAEMSKAEAVKPPEEET